ncbi:MAG: hypothetical protein R3B40_16340 [Polyangiales bacterium]|nr:hypothetical protein [Myxococcales bacterium]MCB9661588.1 hypothetical protein [Sandaracinaceae bacterium]
MTLVFTRWRCLQTGEGSAPAHAYRAATAPEPAALPAGDAVRPAVLAKTADELDDVENAQLLNAWTAGMHADMRLSEVLTDPWPYFEDNEDILEHQLGAPIEWWDVVDADTQERRYVLVLWGNDCGALYPEGVATQVAMVSQFALWCPHDWRLWKALCVAHRRALRHYPESELARMAFAASFRCDQPGCAGRTLLWKESDADEGPCSQCGASVHARDA